MNQKIDNQIIKFGIRQVELVNKTDSIGTLFTLNLTVNPYLSKEQITFLKIVF